jgi:acyl dehydratase
MKGAADRTFESIAVGDRATLRHAVTHKDIAGFAALSGDHNPLHVDAAYAASTPFGKVVVHGFFLGSLVSQLVGMQLPGKRALLMKEALEFKEPVFVGDTVAIEGEVTAKSESTHILTIDIQIHVESKKVATGVLFIRCI